MDRFHFNISHVSGKHLCTADILFQSPVTEAGPNSAAFENKLESFIESVVNTPSQLATEVCKLTVKLKQMTQ